MFINPLQIHISNHKHVWAHVLTFLVASNKFSHPEPFTFEFYQFRSPFDSISRPSHTIYMQKKSDRMQMMIYHIE